MSADFKGCKTESRNGKRGKDWSAKINKIVKEQGTTAVGPEFLILA